MKCSTNTVTRIIAAFALAATAPALKAQSFYVDNGEFSNNYLVFKVTSSGTESYFSNPTSPSAQHPGYLAGLAVDSSYNLYVASGYIAGQNDVGEIDKITPAGVASLYATLPLGSDPGGLAFYGDNLFVTASGKSEILEVTPDGTVSVYATLTKGPLLTRSEDLIFDQKGDLFADTYSGGVGMPSNIYEITPEGTKTIFATLATGVGLVGMAFDASGDLYVDEEFDDKVDKITPDGTVSLFATLPTGSMPFGMTYSDGDLYVAESNKGTIDKITLDGTVSTFATGVAGAPLYIIDPPFAVPEPSTWVEVVLGVLGVLVCRKSFRSTVRSNARKLAWSDH